MNKNASRHSERSKALNAINELASTVDGDKEFQALTILKEKKCSRVSSRGVTGFIFQLCPLVGLSPGRSKVKKLFFGISIRPCSIL